MSVSATFYRSFKRTINNTDQQNWLTATHKCVLCTSTYTPSDAHDFYNDVTNELSTAGGYTAGGTTVGTPSSTITVANSWTVTRAATTAYIVGDLVIPATPNGFIYVCVVAGTSGSGLPSYSTTLGRETSDGTVVWMTLSISICVYSCSATGIQWTSATFSGVRYAIIYKDTGVAATSPLIGYLNFGSDQAVVSGTFKISPHTTNGLFWTA